MALEFSDCELDGVTFDGGGAYYTDSEGHDEMFFDRVSVTQSGEEFYFTGRIAYEYDMPTYFLTVEVASFGETFKFEELSEIWHYYLDGKIETTISGRIYLGGYGHVAISGRYRDFHDYSTGPWEITLQGAGNSQGVLELQPPQAKFMLRRAGSESFDLGTVVTLSELEGNDEVTTTFVTADLVNYPPILPAIYFPQDSYESREGIQFSAFYFGLNKSGFVDGFVDHDGDLVTASCRWSIDEEVIEDITTCWLPPEVAAHSDVVTVILLLSDGKTVVESGPISTMIDNTIPPPVVLAFRFLSDEIPASGSIPIVHTDLVVYEPMSQATHFVWKSYHWFVNDVEVLSGVNQTALYGYEVQEGDVISVYAVLEDGFNVVHTQTLTLVVGP